MLAYNVHVDNDNEVYCIVAPTEKEAIEYAIELYKKDYDIEITKQDCRIVWDYLDEE